MTHHDPLAFAHQLGAKLASRSRHVCVFMGAGAARACGLPDVNGLTQAIHDALSGEQAEAFERLIENQTLEGALSRLRRIYALVDGTTQQVDGLTAEQARSLDRVICDRIIDELDLGNADLEPMRQFAAWLARADYHLPVEIFSLNYDLLVETALEALHVPYFDGFVGTFRARFRTDLVEAAPGDSDAWLPSFITRLWKLHGSVSWEWDEHEVVRLGQPAGKAAPAAVFPSDMKYDESRRVPFVVLQDRLRHALQHPESLTLVTGYSWADAHLNEVIFDAARHRPRSEIVAFSRSGLPDELVERALVTPNLQAVTGSEAILGGVRATWKCQETPPVEVWKDDKLALREFQPLAAFLALSSPLVQERGTRLSPEELEAHLLELVARQARRASA